MAEPIAAAQTAALVSGALKKASASTGVGFDYLYKVAKRESALDPAARAKTSSAAGLFQFIEQTWLASVKKYGAAHGLAEETASITKTAAGRYVVADAAQKTRILDLRFDPEKAAALAGELARENKAALEKALGRAVDAAELYAAHFLGASGAARLLSAPPETEAAALAPQAAAANKPVFFDGARARSVDEIMESFRRTIGAAGVTIANAGETTIKSLAPLLREGAAFFTRGDTARARSAAPDVAALERAAFGTRGSGAGPLQIGAVEYGAVSALRGESGGFGFAGLSPLALAVLQALDPRNVGDGDDD